MVWLARETGPATRRSRRRKRRSRLISNIGDFWNLSGTEVAAPAEGSTSIGDVAWAPACLHVVSLAEIREFVLYVGVDSRRSLALHRQQSDEQVLPVTQLSLQALGRETADENALPMKSGELLPGNEMCPHAAADPEAV